MSERSGDEDKLFDLCLITTLTPQKTTYSICKKHNPPLCESTRIKRNPFRKVKRAVFFNYPKKLNGRFYNEFVIRIKAYAHIDK